METERKWVGSSCSDSSKTPVEVRHFFKVVTNPVDQGLKIPDAFMKKYGGDLEEAVLLKVPNGPSWHVEIVHYGNASFLQKGWPEFAQFYSVKMFHFLVFRYKGNSQFHVLIFDPTALEIEYPSKAKGQRSGSPFVGTELNGDDDVEEEESYQTSQSSKGKRARVEDIEDDVSVEVIGHTRTSDCNSRVRPKTRSSQRLKEQITHSKKASSFVGTHGAAEIDKDKFKSYQEAKAFRSSSPFFVSFMLPSHVSCKFNLNIPCNFMKEHLSMIKEECKFMLHASGSIKKWPVILKIYYGRTARAGIAKITSGFKKFVQDNNLKVGDVCAFELIGQGGREFKITVFRSTEHHQMVA